jgi:hypothetical protein
VDRSTVTDQAGDHGAVYKGLALVSTPAGKFLYATNFRFGTIEVFDSNFHLVNSFTDPTVPAGFAPFGSTTSAATCTSPSPNRTRPSRTTTPGQATASSTSSRRTAPAAAACQPRAGSTPRGQ